MHSLALSGRPRTAPSGYSWNGRLVRTDTMIRDPVEATPGPGAYQTTDYRSIGARFAQSRETPRRQPEKRKPAPYTPGPGDYADVDPGLTRPRSAAFSIGSRAPSFQDAQIRAANRAGPGDYDCARSTLTDHGAYLLRPPSAPQQRNRGWGSENGATPASYNAADAFERMDRSAPAFTLYGAPRDAFFLRRDAMPAPNQYHYQTSTLQRFGAGRMNPINETDERTRRKLARERLRSPAPNQYQTVYARPKEQPGFSFGIRYAYGCRK